MTDETDSARDAVDRRSGTCDEDDMSDAGAPLHPVAAMQEAFEESIQEAAEGDDDSGRASPEDAEARRRDLLDQPTYDPSWTTRWRQRPGARCHPIVKLMSQIIFGLHLLHQRQAKSDAEVVKILQVHVDEIDAFLEKTTEDFDLAIKDIDERLVFLKLPMTHLEVFDVMLDDRKFRSQLIEGNDKIEKIIERTAKAMNAALLDIQKGVNASQQLAQYLDAVQTDWPHDTPDQSAIYVAMKGNEEGWRACLRDLQGKGHQLGVSLVQLGTVVGEMSKLAAAASRRNAGQTSNPQSPSFPGQPQSRPSTSTEEGRPSSEGSQKPLPRDPDPAGAAVRATISQAQNVLLPSKKSKSTVSTKPKKTNSIVHQARKKRAAQGAANPPKPREPTSQETSHTKDAAGSLEGTVSREQLAQQQNQDQPRPAFLPDFVTSIPSHQAQKLRPAANVQERNARDRPSEDSSRQNSRLDLRSSSATPNEGAASQTSRSSPEDIRQSSQQEERSESQPPQSLTTQALPSQRQILSTQRPQLPSQFQQNNIPTSANVPLSTQYMLRPDPGQQGASAAPPPPLQQVPPPAAAPFYPTGFPSVPYQQPQYPAPQRYVPHTLSSSNMQYPMPQAQPAYNALTAIAHRQTGEPREPAPQEYTVTFERPPRAELDSSPVAATRQIVMHSTHNATPAFRSRSEVPQPAEAPLRSSTQAPEMSQTVNTHDPRAPHRPMQSHVEGSPGRASIEQDGQAMQQQEPKRSNDISSLKHNISSSSNGKVDSAYAISAGKAPSDIESSQASSRATSRLGLFPDTTVTTPPHSSRAPSFSHTSPTPVQFTPSAFDAKQSELSSRSNPRHTKKLSNIFKRKPKEAYSYLESSS